MQSSLLTSWGLRDYGTATWEGGDPGCDHLMPPGGGTQASGLWTGNSQEAIERKVEVRRQQFRDPCGKCGARRIDNQIGLEATPELHIEALLEVFKLVWRVLRKDGTLWLNYGDCYACAPNGRKAADIENDDRTFRDKPFSTATNGRRTTQGINLKAKDLVMMPYRLAIALQADGWFVRSAITICKNNPMPESVTDRPTNATEMLFLLTKEPRYYYDATAVRQPHKEESLARIRHGRSLQHKWSEGPGDQTIANDMSHACHPDGRNMRNYLILNAQPMKDAHYAAFSEKLVEPCILAGTSERGVCPTCGAPWERVTEKDYHSEPLYKQTEETTLTEGRNRNVTRMGDGVNVTTTGWRPTCAHVHTEDQLLPALVLDCFAGSGTVSRVASRLGRCSIGIELSEEYVTKIARKRNNQGSLGL